MDTALHPEQLGLARMAAEELRDVVVRNAEGSIALWPSTKTVPDGWIAVAEPRSRRRSLEYIDELHEDAPPRGVKTAWPIGPATSLRKQPCVHELFQVHAQRHPTDRAVETAQRSMTYAELNGRANMLAGSLCEAGIEPETVVAVVLERSIDWVTSLLAVLKAGGVYVSVDPSYPQERIEYIIRDSDSKLVISRRRLAGLLAGERVLFLTDDDGAKLGSATDLEPRASPRSLAYLIYTSGSTGWPKGVLLEHGAVANVIKASQVAFGVSRGWRILQYVSPSFDAAVWDVFLALASGATLCLGPARPGAADVTISDLLNERKIDYVFLPPALLATVPPASATPPRVVVTGGDRVPSDLVDAWVERTRLFVAYGPTEGTIVVSWAELASSSPLPPALGDLIPGAEWYVLDDQLEPVRPGIVGELWLGGASLARGYHRRPSLTAQVFLPDPFSAEPGTRMYRTGDLVVADRGGALRFVGRIDQQVKVRGFRVEPGEIEAALLLSPEIADAVVVARPGPRGVTRLRAFVVPTATAAVDTRRLRADLTTRLPDHMVPATIDCVPAFPLTPNGKVDRGALAARA